MTPSRIPRFLSYVVVGGAAASLQLVLLAALVEVAGVPATMASVLAFYLATTANYFLQSRFTFRSTVPHRVALPKFLAVSSFGAVVNVLAFTLLSLAMHYLAAQAIALLLVVGVNYAASRAFVFGPAAAPGSREAG